jgi:hypothetical protein
MDLEDDDINNDLIEANHSLAKISEQLDELQDSVNQIARAVYNAQMVVGTVCATVVLIVILRGIQLAWRWLTG